MERSTLVIIVGVLVLVAFYTAVIVAGVKRGQWRELARTEREKELKLFKPEHEVSDLLKDGED